MKLVSLNTWGAKAYDALVLFIQKERTTTDVFLFQEVWHSPQETPEQSRGMRLHLFEELQGLLPDFSGRFFPVQDGLDVEGRVAVATTAGQAIFVKNGIPVLSEGQVFTHREKNASPEGWDDIPTCFCYVRVPFRGKELCVMNFHGIPFPGDKRDTPARLMQSRRLLDFMERESNSLILAGDFNLMPETESIHMLERAGFKNLIIDYAIRTTRSTISPFYGTPEQQNFADFTFVSKDITVTSFDVPPECVASDHLPMILTFS